MQSQSVKNMTSGNIAKLIVSFAVPLLAGNLFQQLYNMVDTIIVGRGIGVEALAAVGSTGSINFLVLGFVLGLTQGLSILVSQYYGAQNYKKIKKTITMSAYLYMVIGVLISIISVIFSKDLLKVLKTPDNIIIAADQYIRIIFAGIIVTIAFNFFSGILRALGDGKTPTYSLLISSLINIVLDLVFIINFNMGVKGAAYATVIAQAVSAVFCFYKVYMIKEIRLHKEDWKFNMNLVKRSFNLGIPVALMNSVTAVGCMVLQVFVNGYGSVYVAAYSASSKIVEILEQFGTTFGFAISTFAGQNLGAGKIARIKEGVKKTNIISGTVNIIIAVIMVVFGRSILRLFVSGNETKVISVGYQYTAITSIMLVVLGMLFVYRYTLQSLGDTFIPMLSGIAELITRIVVIIILSSALGFTAVAVAEVSAWLAAMMMLMAAYHYRIKSL